MCGRFVSATPPDELATYFGATTIAAETEGPSYNVAPTNSVFVVYEDGGVRNLDTFRWGLIPSWAKDMTIGSKMINARAETVKEKASFKRPLAKRRCIIPADGFFEWKPVAAGETGGLNKRGPKQPYFISRPDGEPFAFAGLWEVWRGGPAGGSTSGHESSGHESSGHESSGHESSGHESSGHESSGHESSGHESSGPTVVHSCTILTGAPNSQMAKLHDRMPIILPPSAWDVWLDRDETSVDTVGKFLVPAPPELIQFHPVSTAVNTVRNKGPELIEPVDVSGDQSLF